MSTDTRSLPPHILAAARSVLSSKWPCNQVMTVVLTDGTSASILSPHNCDQFGPDVYRIGFKRIKGKWELEMWRWPNEKTIYPLKPASEAQPEEQNEWQKYLATKRAIAAMPIKKPGAQ